MSKKILSVMIGMVMVCSNVLAQDSDTASVVKGMNEFAFDLYGQLKAQDGNLFCSPYSISTALAMTYAGARGNTAAEMARVLHFSLPQDRLHPATGTLVNATKPGAGGYELVIANALWGQQGSDFLPDFVSLTKEYYGAGFNTVDFKNQTESSRLTINSWVSEQTKQKIKDLLAPGILTELTRLVLTNAIYFKGNWAAQFKKEDTQALPFYLSSGQAINAPLMCREGEYKYTEISMVQVLELSYIGQELSMIVLLPKTVDGINALEQGLSAQTITRYLPARQQKVRVYLPKFKFDSAFTLNQPLESLGMPEAFTSKADFSGIEPKKELYISKVVHKAFVEVNEEGTEAAAATAVETKYLAFREEPTPILFRADRPFIFLIRDNRSGAILFIGRVMNPAE